MSADNQQAELDLVPAKFDCPYWFEIWHVENRHIVNEFIRRAREMKQSGRERYSARCIIERIRWDTDLADSTVEFKISGNAVPWISRLVMYECPDLEGFFATREVRS